MNKKLLLRIAEDIEQNPKTFDINSCSVNPKQPTCIAGKALLLSGYPLGNFIHFPTAEELLGITKTQGDNLFLIDNWPQVYRLRHELATSESCLQTEEEAKATAHITKASAAADLIRAFVNGEETLKYKAS